MSTENQLDSRIEGDDDSINASLDDNYDQDDTTLSLNDDLASFSARSNSITRRSFESSSVFTSSFRPSFDDSLPSLGLNKLSIQTVSPLGPNSIFEIISDADMKKHRSPLNPAHHKLNIPPPTQKDIPLIQLTKLEKISKNELQDYLRLISKDFEKYNSSKIINTSNLKKLSNIKINNEYNLDSIPEIFFNNKFNLDDQRIFKSVTGNVDLNQINHILHDKLSNYLDIIEVNLVEEISKNSNSFFDALNDLNDISDKNSKTLESINALKLKLEKLKEHKINHNLKKINLQNKRDNVSKLEQSLLQINIILKEYQVSNSLFLKSEYEECLTKIDHIENLINGEDTLNLNWPYKLQNYNNFEMLSKVKQDLNELRSKAGQSISKLFVSFLLNDLRSNYENIDYLEILKKIINDEQYKSSVDNEFKTQLNQYLLGLIKSNELSSSFKSYQDQVINEMKNIVRVFLPNEQEIESANNSEASSSQQQSKSLSMLIKLMTPKEFEDMLIKIFTSVLQGLRRLKLHQKLLLDLTLNNNNVNPNLFSNLDIKDCINKSIEIIQLRLGKIIQVRKDLNSSLRLDYLLRLFFILKIFLNECEIISGFNFKFLPDILNQQIKNFNGNLQNLNFKNILSSIEIEEWKPLIVTKNLQLIVNNIVNNENLEFNNEWRLQLLNEEVEKEVEENSHKRSIVVRDKTFVANNSLLNLILIIKDLFILKSNFNHLSIIYESNLIELLKFYNIKTMSSIKNSDNSLNKDKNLSVVGESFDCISELIHYIRLDFNNMENDDAYNNLLAGIKSSKGKIDSINTIPE